MSNCFIPRQIIVGIGSSDIGWVTCFFKQQKWIGESIFERITGGFKPHVQRDSEKQLKKIITSAVIDFENIPIKGFRLAKLSCGNSYKERNIYGISEFHYRDNVILEDPRGFKIAISLYELSDLLKECNMSMEEGLIDLELCYYWNSSEPRAHLISTKNTVYEKLKKESDDLIDSKLNAKYIKQSNLKIGAVYSANSDKIPSGCYMYMGKHDVYSISCQKTALRYRSYKYYDKFLNDRQDMTGQNRHIFYRLGAKNTSYKKEDCPYHYMTSLSKMFFEDPIKTDLHQYKMYNDQSRECSFENIKADMDQNVAFNKIDLQDEYGIEPLDFDTFDSEYNPNRKYNTKVWPYVNYYRTYLIDGSGKCKELSYIQNYGYNASVMNMFKCQLYELNKTEENMSDERHTGYYGSCCNYARRSGRYVQYEVKDFHELYDIIKPNVLKLKLENGNMMDKSQRLSFLYPEYENTLKYYYPY